MGNLTHKAVRAAAGLGIDQILKKVNRGDREAEMVKLLDMMNKYIAGSNLSVDFDAICNMVTGPVRSSHRKRRLQADAPFALL